MSTAAYPADVFPRPVLGPANARNRNLAAMSWAMIRICRVLSPVKLVVRSVISRSFHLLQGPAGAFINSTSSKRLPRSSNQGVAW